MRFPKRIVIFAAAALIGGLGSYSVGVNGINPAQVITESRCGSGAFITHVKPGAELGADAHGSTKESATTTAEHDVATAHTLPAAAVGANLIANPGVETLAGAAPDGWSNNRTGTNDAIFNQVAGHDSGRALRVDITKYTDGNAEWYPRNITVKPGSYYAYTDWYRSNVPTRIILMLKNAQGKQQYFSVGTAPASMAWAQSSVRFFVPTDVSEILVSHNLDRLGSLETDDYVLTEATPTGFDQPLVSVTFDDGYSSIHDTALPLMQRYSVASTQYVVSGLLGSKGYAKPGQLYDFTRSGHEIAAHSLDHQDLTGLADKDLTRELTTPQKGLSKCFGETTDFAAPYGAYNIHTTTAVKATYRTARSTDVGFNSIDQFNPYELKVQNVRADTSPEQIQAWLDTAKSTHTWLILVYHRVDDSHSEYSRTQADFESDIQKVVASGIAVKTVRDAYSQVKPQLTK